ncbi:MAG: hypothetical protein EOO47_23210, partial [Flavobacterium sp.]
MKNHLSIFIFLLFISLSVKAQRNSIGVGPSIHLPSGSSSNISGIGFGGFVKAEIGLSPKFSLTVQGDLAHFVGKRVRVIGTSIQSITSVPVKAGLKYYTGEDFYLEGQLGAAFPIEGTKKTAFAWSPGIGTFVRNKNNSNYLDFGIRYEAWTSASVSATSGRSLSSFNYFA